MFNDDTTCSTTTGAATQLFASAINFLAATQCFVQEALHQPYQYTTDYETYDFIVVGAGSAGSVVASRLSEVTHWKILLLEAGSEPPIESDIPHLSTTLYNTKYDWSYYTQNDGVTHQSLKDGSVHWARGKMLGGSSSLNDMAYIRGRDHDFTTWQNGGNPSWSPENVNNYFKKAENYQNIKLLEDTDIKNTYGRQGPLIINTVNSTHPEITERILESWDILGFKRAKDVNAAKFKGWGLSGILSNTAANGRRYSTYRSYLKLIKQRTNLNIIPNAFVTKILINDNYEAYGVEVKVHGKKKIFYTNKEVIISAGSINTPQLLMLSGIGPKKHLVSKDISCIVNLPGVGQNLQDHPLVLIPIYGDEPGYENQAEKLFQIALYMYNKSGLLAQNVFSDISAFFSRNKNMHYPELQSHILLFRKKSQSIAIVFGQYRTDIKKSFTDLNADKALYAFSLIPLHPSSRGSIYLNSSDPNDHPIINSNYFREDEDLQVTVDGIKMLTKIVNTPYFKSINAFVHRVNIPECNQYEFESDNYWKCYTINTCITMYHPVGTAKMGPNPKEAVVDNFLKVHGVKGLRVIDASVMPTITSGNTNAPTIMIAEMGSDMIKMEYFHNS